jgi:hypothetical protein
VGLTQTFRVSHAPTPRSTLHTPVDPHKTQTIATGNATKDAVDPETPGGVTLVPKEHTLQVPGTLLAYHVEH